MEAHIKHSHSRGLHDCNAVGETLPHSVVPSIQGFDSLELHQTEMHVNVCTLYATCTVCMHVLNDHTTGHIYEVLDTLTGT